MNPLMLQQVLSTARTLPGKAGNSGSDADSAGSGIGGFAAVVQSALAGDAPTTQGKAAAEELANPLAALLLAALFAQVQPMMAEAAQSDDTAQAVDALTAGSVSSDDTAPIQGAFTLGGDLSALLQRLGLSEADAQSFIQQLSATLQAAQPAAQPAPQSVRQIAAQSAAVTTTIGTIAPQTEGGETPIAQVSALLDKLLGDVIAPQGAQAPAAPAQLDTAMALALRELLASLSDQGAMPRSLQNAQSASTTPDTPAAAPQAVAAATVDEQGVAAQDDPSTGGDPNAASLTNTAAQFVAAPHSDAPAEVQSAPVQSTQRTLGEAFDTMVDTITSLRNSSRNEMEIRLKPDFLGKVVIRLTMEQGSLVARISASNASVQDAFQAQAPQLTAVLQQQGIRDVTVLVTHDMASGNALGQSTTRQQPNSREQRRRNYQVSDVAEKSDAARATAAYEQFWRSGTINYLA